MRLAIPLIALGFAFSGTTARAQAVASPHPSVPSGQPSFRVPMDLPPLRAAKGPSLSDISGPAFEFINRLADVYTCPMPVDHPDTSKQEPMPVTRGGTPEPMPVAKPGCSNPLDRVR